MSEIDNFANKLAMRAPAPKYQARKAFAESFSLITKSMSESIPIKAILEDFNSSYGLDVSLARFRQMLREQRKIQNTTTDSDQARGEVAE